MSRKSDFISEYRQLTAQLLEVQGELEQRRLEWDSLDYGNTMTQDDFIGDNASILKADLVASVSSVGAVTTLLSQGHRTNLYKII